MVEHVQVVSDPGAPGWLWSPSIGPETSRLLVSAKLDDESRDRVEDQSVGVLASCLPPTAAGSRTGLVIGYVQSGKTLSFTTVTALARDNGYALVVLLAGTKTNLHRQTSRRLRKDLEVEREGGMSPWLLVENPKAGGQDAESVAKAVATSVAIGVPEAFRQTVVITVMKNATRLDAVTTAIHHMVQQGILTAKSPVLIVDDEADQAGLNAASADDPTATYAAIMRMRRSLPAHTYLMYTATPQAPLLLNLADTLSPDFVRVLDAGGDYTGGEYFFVEHRASFVEPIPESETLAAIDLDTQAPPSSLLDALATFLVGVVSQQGKRQLAMLVHPSHTKDLHNRYRQWVTGALDAWRLTLGEPGPDRAELVTEIIEPAWRALALAGAPVIPLEEVIRSLPYYLLKVQVRVVNSEVPEEEGIQWGSSPAWVLVGGNKLDRGFTVEGLSVTYMPRGTGVGNADTIQQRARFFGYKRPYAEFCRAWLAPETELAFSRYVEHERYLRKELAGLEKEGKGLKGWKRKMLLAPELKPCRRAVVGLPYLHSRVPGEKWMRFERIAHLGATETEGNRQLVSRLVTEGGLGWIEHSADTRSTNRHKVATAPLVHVLDRFLASWAAHPIDRAALNQLLLVLSARLDDAPGEMVDVIWMRAGTARERSLLSQDEGLVLNLQEGHRPGDRGDGFVGDSAFREPERLTLQIYNVNAIDKQTKELVAPDLRGLAVWVPRHLAGGALVEPSK
ncbi:Z1 domain-containing protein [Cellulomonas sp. URHD0024]|uniref:Z1 domain-containing protein n=1 Tax=Cellulomonas sp. URHD0024 TaxID=1302620 RepID=UPI0003FFEAB2|nr:Z1 domain-containing protein [Cellulomonas sp. URHD0024]